MEYMCSCGNISKICFSSFRRGSRCNKCGTKRGSEKQKHSLKYIEQHFKDHDCKLLEKEYINSGVNMKYICSCGNISKISFDNFKNGKRCRKCSGCEKYTLKYVKQYFEDNNYKLLEDNYKDADTKMKYECSSGHIGEITFSSFKQGHRCSQCFGNKKHTLEYTKQYFKDEGCELLETEYINNSTLMKYICNCENISKICFNHFKDGCRCEKCAINKRKKTMIKKYGVACFPNKSYSKESQKLFDAIYDKLSKKQKKKTYYATLNKEFEIGYKNKYFKYDYVNSKFKKVIEYNGSVWHPLPHLNDDDIGWFAFDKNKTAKEARDYEKIKYEGLEKRGYQILTVWDHELHKDLDTLVEKCLDFLVT